MNENNFIQINGLTHQYAHMGDPALHDINLQIPQACSFGLLGPNGAGKTTLLSILTGLIAPQSGDIVIAGLSIRSHGSEIKTLSSLVPQDFAFYSQLTGMENLQFFARIYGLSDSQFKLRLAYCVQTCQLQDMLSRRVGEYSGGMKRRLNLAIGLLNSPKILYLDEPTVGIDALSRQIIIAAIQSLRAQGTTIIYTSHYMEEVEAICDELAIINHGRVISRARTEQLRQQGNQKVLLLTFAAIPSDSLLSILSQWHVQRIHERQFELTLADANQIGRVLDACRTEHMMIEQLQFGISKLEQTYLSLLKENEAMSEPAT